MLFSIQESVTGKTRDRSVFVSASAIVAIVVILSSLIGPFVLRFHNGCTYESQDVSRLLAGPSWLHPLGTDILGRDLLVRLLYGGRISLAVGLVATLIATAIGTVYGAVAGYAGSRTDAVMMRIVDVIYSLPYMILVVILLALFERSLVLLFMAIGSVSWLTMARIVRGQVLSLKNEVFVEAARATGATTVEILNRHLIPNVMGIVIAYSALSLPAMVLQEAFLSFLGLGVQPPVPSWGILVSEGVQAMAVQPMLVIAPAVLMAITLFSLNSFGESLLDRFDPLRKKE